MKHFPRRTAFGRAAAALATAVLAYLALRPSPYLHELPWLPAWFSRWADHHGVLRNTAAFFGLGLLVFGLVGRNWPYVLGVTVFAVGVEVAQIWIPHRFFDLKDIAASLAGIAPAWLGVVFARWLWRHTLRVLPASAPPR